MKKIISALTLGALIAGAAFADVSVNLNLRQRANLFAYGKGDNGKKVNPLTGKVDSVDSKKALFTDMYSGSGTDNLAISLSGDIVSFDMQWVSDASNTSMWRAKGLNGSVFFGPVTVFAGLWADGKQNGAYRAKPLCDQANLEGVEFEWKKMGSGFQNTPDNWVDNMVGKIGKNLPEQWAAGVAYKVPGINNGALTLNAVYVSNQNSEGGNEKKTDGDGEDGTFAGHTFNFVADGRLDGLGQAEFCVKYGEYGVHKETKDIVNALAIGLFTQPKISRKLVLTVGGSMGMIDGDFIDYDVDVRAHWTIKPNKLSITSFHSFQALVDGEDAAAKYGVGNSTIKGLAESSASVQMSGAPVNNDMVEASNIAVRYLPNKKVGLTAIVGEMVGLGDNLGKDAETWLQLRASLWAQFYADPNNSVEIGYIFSMNDVLDNNNYNSISMGVPVIFRVKL